MNTIKKLFCIADITLLFDSDILIENESEFDNFYGAGKPGYIITFREIDELTCCKSKFIQELPGVDIYFDSSKGFIRQFHEERANALPYAVQFCDFGKKEITIKYLRDGVKNINHIGGAFFHVSLEDIMLRERRLILHACCVETESGGILFSGMSGVGKSTQGELWCRHEKAKMINGDRPILYKTNGIWIAFGSPYAGSSKCHMNVSTPVHAIVMLQQAKKCSIRKLDPAKAFRKVFSQLTLSYWDPVCVKTACDLTEQLIAEIPVYEMLCTPDYAAVELLKKTLWQEVTP